MIRKSLLLTVTSALLDRSGAGRHAGGQGHHSPYGDELQRPAWADNFVTARIAMNGVDLTTSENPLKNDQEAQKILGCGQFLAQMFAGGAFQDNAARP